VRRRLLNFLTAPSLLLCVAVLVLWLRGRSAVDHGWLVLQATGPPAFDENGLVVWSARGQLFIAWLRGEWVMSGTIGSPGSHRGLWLWASAESELHERVTWRPVPSVGGVQRELSWGGFGASQGHITAVTVPHWSAALLLATLPAARLYRRVRGPSKPGLCSACGYNLRATPDRCPECGEEGPDQRN
jgi:hypothetical protein